MFISNKITIVWSIFLVLLTADVVYGAQAMRVELLKKAEKGYVTLLDIPGLNDVTLPEDLKDTLERMRITSVTIEPAGPGIRITGKAKYGTAAVTVIGIVKMLPTIQSCLQITFPQAWQFSDLHKKLSPVDFLKFSKAALVITNYIIPSYIYGEPLWANMTLQPGVNIIGTVVFDPESKVAKVVPGINQLVVHGLLTPTLEGSSVMGIWPVQVSLSEDVKTIDLSIGVEIPRAEDVVVGGAMVTDLGPTIVIETGLQVTLPEQKAPLFFRTAWNFMPLQVRIEGAMDNMWKNPFGIEGINIGNMGIEGTLSYLGMLTGMGLRGQIDIGRRRIIVGAKGAIGSSSSTGAADKKTPAIFGGIVLIGEFQGGLYLTDLATWAMDIAYASTGKQLVIPSQNIPSFGLSNIKIYIVPTVTEIAEKTYPRGITVSGTLQLAGVDVALYLQLSGMGVRGFGSVETLALGPLTITGAGEDKKVGTADDGVIVNVQLDPARQEIYIDGLVQLALCGTTLQSEQHLLINKKGISYQTAADILRTKFLLDVSLPLTDVDKGYVKGRMTQESLKAFAESLQEGVRAVVESPQDDVHIEQNRTKAKIKKLKKSIATHKKKCKKLNPASCAKIITLNSQLTGLYAYEKVLLKAGARGAKLIAVNASFITKATNALASGIQTAFNIQEVSFEGYIRDFTSAVLPKVRVKGILLGKKWDKTMQWDLSDPASAVEEIIDQLQNALT